jgi:hypothetical protein
MLSTKERLDFEKVWLHLCDKANYCLDYGNASDREIAFWQCSTPEQQEYLQFCFEHLGYGRYVPTDA